MIGKFSTDCRCFRTLWNLMPQNATWPWYPRGYPFLTKSGIINFIHISKINVCPQLNFRWRCQCPKLFERDSVVMLGNFRIFAQQEWETQKEQLLRSLHVVSFTRDTMQFETRHLQGRVPYNLSCFVNFTRCPFLIDVPYNGYSVHHSHLIHDFSLLIFIDCRVLVPAPLLWRAWHGLAPPWRASCIDLWHFLQHCDCSEIKIDSTA